MPIWCYIEQSPWHLQTQHSGTLLVYMPPSVIELPIPFLFIKKENMKEKINPILNLHSATISYMLLAHVMKHIYKGQAIKYLYIISTKTIGELKIILKKIMHYLQEYIASSQPVFLFCFDNIFYITRHPFSSLILDIFKLNFCQCTSVEHQINHSKSIQRELLLNNEFTKLISIM